MHSCALVLAVSLASGFGPFATGRAPVTSDARPAARTAPAWDAVGLVEVPWRGYRAAVGSFQGPRCPHTPSCSLYAMQAVSRHGLVAGAIVSAHRLYRGRRSSAARELARDRDGRWVDRLEDATFWLEQGPR
jgi:hypothetical protein